MGIRPRINRRRRQLLWLLASIVLALVVIVGFTDTNPARVLACTWDREAGGVTTTSPDC